MSKNMMKLMSLASIVAASDFEKIYSNPRYIISCNNPNKTPPMSEEKKKRIHDAYLRQFHVFKINGVEICAKSKKDAKKIYSKTKGGNNDK